MFPRSNAPSTGILSGGVEVDRYVGASAFYLMPASYECCNSLIKPLSLPIMDYSGLIPKVKASIAFIVVFDSATKPLGTGSGFVFSKPGILITCNHVVKDGVSVALKFPDAEFISGEIVIRDEEHDLAVIRFADPARQPLPLGDFKKVTEGMPVVFSGYPFSSQNLTTHQGILSAIIKDAAGVTNYSIDGTVNSGNSGCPLMTPAGEVIGVVNAKRRNRNDLLERVEKLQSGAVSLHGIDLVEIYQALAENSQLGVGNAIPAFYIPEHKDPDVPKENPVFTPEKPTKPKK